MDFPNRTRGEGAETWRMLRTKMELRLRLDPGLGWCVGLGHLFSPLRAQFLPRPRHMEPVRRNISTSHFILKSIMRLYQMTRKIKKQLR